MMPSKTSSLRADKRKICLRLKIANLYPLSRFRRTVPSHIAPAVAKRTTTDCKDSEKGPSCLGRSRLEAARDWRLRELLEKSSFEATQGRRLCELFEKSLSESSSTFNHEPPRR